jgi:hypothetical protein
MKHVGKEPFPPLYVDPKPDSEAAKAGAKYEPIAKAQLKKITKLWQQEVSQIVLNVYNLLQFFKGRNRSRNMPFLPVNAPHPLVILFDLFIYLFFNNLIRSQRYAVWYRYIQSIRIFF